MQKQYSGAKSQPNNQLDLVEPIVGYETYLDAINAA